MKEKTETEILRDALVSIAKNDEIWRDAVNECLRLADNAKQKTFTIEEVEEIIQDVIRADDLIVECPNTSYLILHWTNWQQKKKQLLGGGDE